MTHIINPQVTERQLQIIKGTILGGSSIIKPLGGKNCYLSMRSKNGKWLEYKGAELQSLASGTPFTLEKTNRWHSLCYPIFNELKKMFYKDKKRNLTMETLDACRLNDLAFTVWYGDAAICHKEIVTFNTHIWGKQGNEILVEYFGYLGYHSEIVKERQSYRLRLDKSSSIGLTNMIRPHCRGLF